MDHLLLYMTASDNQQPKLPADFDQLLNGHVGDDESSDSDIFREETLKEKEERK